MISVSVRNYLILNGRIVGAPRPKYVILRTFLAGSKSYGNN